MEKRYGKFTVTGTRLGILLDHVIAVNREHSGAFDRKQFTEVIGASPTSNGPAEKLNDMIDFGLLSKDDRGYAITDLGGASIHSDKVERIAAIEKIIRKIPLWDLLLDSIGQNPDRETFAQALEQNLPNEDVPVTRNLDRLWHAYLEDVSCITKTPPYSKGSALLGRQKNMRGHSSKNVKSPKKNATQFETSIEQNQMTDTPKDRTSSIEHGLFKEPLIIEFGSMKFEVKDPLSIRFARLLIEAKEDGLKRGDDYEKH